MPTENKPADLSALQPQLAEIISLLKTLVKQNNELQNEISIIADYYRPSGY